MRRHWKDAVEVVNFRNLGDSSVVQMERSVVEICHIQ